jgi:GWxTD domain-containing protein
MKRATNLLFLLFLLCIPLTTSLLANKEKNMCLDFARFRYDEENTYLEIYYLIENLTATSDEFAYLDLEILENTSDSLLAKQPIDIEFEQSDKKFGSVKMGMVKSVLPEGQYKIRLSRYDDSSRDNKVDSLITDFSTASFAQEKIALSDLELCLNIVPNSTNKDAPFYKNTMEVMPNPANIYDEQHPRLYYYIELYNVNKENSGEDIYFQVVILDKDGQIRSEKKYKRPRNYESLVEKGAFNVSKFEAGLYSLIFAVADTISNYSVSRRMTFYIDNPNVVVIEEEQDQERLFLHSRFFAMSNEMLDEGFGQSQYVATPEEVKIYRSLVDTESRKRFLFKFWRERERENPGYEEEYFRRVDYANENFRYSGEKGWKTDRGRVYIVYGPPDQKEKAGAADFISSNQLLTTPGASVETSGQNPHTVWYYHGIEGGVKFYFIDHNSVGNYRLVHSTHTNEVRNPNWEQELYK